MAEKTTTTKAPAESKAEDIRTMSIDRKMLELQKSVRALDKDSENKHFNYRFVSGSKLLGVVRPKMDELGLTLTQTIIPESIEKTGNSIFMLLRFVWHDAYTGQTREDLWPAYGTNNSLDKAIGCAMTYAERYYIMKQLHIATDEDDVDGMEPVQPQQPARAQAKPAQPRQMETKPEQANPEQAKKVRLTVDSYQQGLCEAIVEHMVKRADKGTGVIPESEYNFIRDRYEWEPEAFGLVYGEACKRAKANIQQPQK